MATKNFLAQGTHVQLYVNGTMYDGTVISAHNYPDSKGDCWYIELTDMRGRVRYWKQDLDGGQLTQISHKPADSKREE